MNVKLGPVELPSDLLLAPMMDITTPSFRQLIINHGGVGMVVTPMIFVQQFVQAPKTVIPHLEHIESQRPAAIQIVASGKNLDDIKLTLDFLSSFEFDIVDINAGCPAPHTVRSGGGGALIKECFIDNSSESKSRLEKIMETCIKYAPTPVSLKTRLGFSDPNEILSLLPIIENHGISFLTLHGRTIKQKYTGSVDLEMIKVAKEAANIPVVGNGDVKSYADYLKMKEITKCDAVMIGRAVTYNPFIFHEIFQNSQGLESQYTCDLSVDEILKLIKTNIEFIRSSSQYWNTDRFILAETRRLGIWFIKGLSGYKIVREKLSKFRNLNELMDYLYGNGFQEDLSPES